MLDGEDQPSLYPGVTFFEAGQPAISGRCELGIILLIIDSMKHVDRRLVNSAEEW